MSAAAVAAGESSGDSGSGSSSSGSSSDEEDDEQARGRRRQSMPAVLGAAAQLLHTQRFRPQVALSTPAAPLQPPLVLARFYRA
eukprot:COSAG06_NODE_21215_length_765_cov_1.295796_1_plen_83_part_10